MVEEEESERGEGGGREERGEKETYGVCGAVQFNGGGEGVAIVTAQIHMGMGGIVWG